MLVEIISSGDRYMIVNEAVLRSGEKAPGATCGCLDTMLYNGEIMAVVTAAYQARPVNGLDTTKCF